MENLKELRKSNKQTQEEIAKQINTTQQTYARYEIGTSEPTIETLIKLADIYGVSLDYLVGRKFKNNIGYLNENEKAILKIMKQLNEYNQIKLIAEAQGMLIAQN